MDIGDHVRAHQLLGGMPGAFPWLSTAVSLKRIPGLTFGAGVSALAAEANSTRVLAAIADALARNKVIEADHVDRGPLCLGGNVVHALDVDVHAPYGPMAELRLTGERTDTLNCVRLPSAYGAREYSNLRIVKEATRACKVLSYARDAAGFATFGLDRPLPPQLAAGDGVESWWHEGWNAAQTIVSVSGDRLTVVTSGSPASVLTPDLARSATVSRVERRGNELTFTVPVGHGFRPGMLASTTGGDIGTRVLKSFTGTTSAGTTPNVSDRFTVPSPPATPTLTAGDESYRISAANGAFPPGTRVRAVSTSSDGNSTNDFGYANKYATVSGSTTISICDREMTFSDLVIDRVTPTTVTVSQAGPDDIATSIDAGLRLIESATDRWAELRALRSQWSGGSQCTLSAGGGRGHQLRDIEVCGTGMQLFSLAEAELLRCKALDTIADGIHFASGDGASGQNRVLQCRTWNTGDDGISLIAYAGGGGQHTQARVDGCENGRSRAHGLRVTGACAALVTNHVARSCVSGAIGVEAAGPYNVLGQHQITIRGAHAVGCGNWWRSAGNAADVTTGIGTAASAALVIAGGANILVQDFVAQNAHHDGVVVRSRSSRVRLLDGAIDWAYNHAVALLGSGANDGCDFTIERYRITEPGAAVLFADAGRRGRLRYHDLEVEDAGWRPGNSVAGIAISGYLGAVERGTVRWRYQAPTLSAAYLQAMPAGVGQVRSIAPSEYPIFSGSAIEVADGGRRGQENVTLLGVTRWSHIAGRDHEFELTREARERGFTARFWTLYHDGTPINAQIYGAENLDVWSGPGGTGTQLFGASMALKGLMAFRETIMGAPNAKVRIPRVTSGSPILRFNSDDRCDEAAVGWSLAATGIPTDAYIAGVDRSGQRAILARRPFTIAAVTGASTTLTLPATDPHVHVGMVVRGSIIPNSVTTVTGVAGTAVTLSQAVTGAGPATITFFPVVVAFGLSQRDTDTIATLTEGSAVVSVSPTTDIAAGFGAFGDGIPEGATVLSTTGSTVTLSAPATVGGPRPVTFLGTPYACTVSGTDVSADLRPSQALSAATQRSAYVRVSGFDVGRGLNTSGVNVARLYGVLGSPPLRMPRFETGATVPVDASIVSRVTSTIAAAATIAAPTVGSTPVLDGDELTYDLTQNATGGYSIDWNAVFVNAAGSAMGASSGTANTRRIVTFRWHRAAWRLIADSGWA